MKRHVIVDWSFRNNSEREELQLGSLQSCIIRVSSLGWWLKSSCGAGKCAESLKRTDLYTKS